MSEGHDQALERRLQEDCDEAIWHFFGDPDSAPEDFDPAEFRAEIEEKGATVTLSLPDGGSHQVPGEMFVEFVWGLIANA